MTTAEKFKVWLETVYVSEKTGKALTTGTQYVTGLNALNKKLNLAGDGIFDEAADLELIRKLIDRPENFHKDYSSHYNAFLKYRHYYSERNDTKKKPLQRQTDIFKKQKVEIAAVETVIRHFENLDYIVVSKEKDNAGWDLEASNSKETLLLEVKGLSGKIVSIELSPNEYQKSREKIAQYKLCIVTKALINPKLEVFSFDLLSNCWTNDYNERLLIEERIAARFTKTDI